MVDLRIDNRIRKLQIVKEYSTVLFDLKLINKIWLQLTKYRY